MGGAFFLIGLEPGELGYVSFGYDFSPLVDQAALNEAGSIALGEARVPLTK